MADKEQFGISEQLNCSDCVNHGGDWDCDHVQCRKGADTISRKAVLQVLPRSRFNSDDAYFEALYEIEHLPTVDAVPVVHGHWIDLEPQGDSRFMCTVCKWKEKVPTCMGEPTIWRFCPSCGARMDGKDGDGNG